MAIPTARLTLECLRILGVPAVVLGAGHTRYARVAVKAGSGPEQISGRSRPLPAAGGDFDLTPEASPWTFEVNVDPGTSVSLQVELCEDRGDTAPPTPTVITGTINDPWGPGTHTFGATPGCEVRISRTIIKTTDPAFVARAGLASGVSGTLTVPQALAVEIVDILGLYKPNPTAVPPAPGATHVVGYHSEDDQGRVFTNRRPDGTWASDTQFIEVQARITGLGGLVIPAGATVRWTVSDIDDPTNDTSTFHRDWGRYVDANDYNAAGDPVGAHQNDNAAAHSPGNANEDLLFGTGVSGSARWATATGGPTPSPTSRTQAETPIAGTGTTAGTSSVRIHCPNVLGTNFLVRVALNGIPTGIPVYPTKTGMITMWSRLDVEVIRMAGAHSVNGALANIPRFFHPTCVQLDFQLERVVSGTLDRANMASSRNTLTARTRAWVDDPGVFTHRGQGGWFFLGAARFPNPLPAGAAPPPLHTGTAYTLGTTGTDVWVRVPAALANPDYVTFTWTDGAGRTHKAGFDVESAPVSGGSTRIVLSGNDVTPGFTGHDANGSLAHAYATQSYYYPRHQLASGAAALTPGGFGVPVTGATVEVLPPGAVFVTGISPSVPSGRAGPGVPRGTGSFFAGRTVLFTHTRKFSTGATPPAPRADFNQRVLSTVVHEFLHAFGMPHKCGFWNWRTPRTPSGKSCCMNYFDTWLIDTSNNVIPSTVGNQGDDMCGRHLMEVRRVHLERNLGLNW